MTHRGGRLTSLPLLVFPALAAGQGDLVIQAQFGRQALAAGRYQEAVAIYSGLVKRMPSNGGLRLNLGMAQHLSEDHKGAVASLEAALKLDSSLAPARLFLGGSWMKLGEPAKAVPHLRAFAASDPGHKESRQLLGDALLALDRPREAVAYFQRWVELDPQNARAWVSLGRAWEGVAREAFQQLEKTQPGSAWGYALAGEARYRQRQFSSAFYLLRESLKREPNLGGAREMIASIYRQTGHPDWAAAEESAARKVTPARPHALYTRAGDAQREAARAFEAVLKLPPSAETHRFLAETFRLQKRHVEEVEQWEAVLRLEEGNPALLTELAIAKHYAKDDAGAQAILEKLLPTDPESAQWNFMLGDTLLAQQKVDAAIPHLRKAVAGEPAMLAGLSSLGRALVLAGKGAEAIPHLQKALAIDRDGALHFQIARAYQSAGQAGQARQALARYQEIRKRMEAEKEVLEEEVRITPP